MEREQWKIRTIPSMPNDSILFMTDEERKPYETTESYIRRLIDEGKIVVLRNIKVE